MAIYILLYTAVTAITTTVAWSPKSQVELKGAIAECLKGGDCSKGPHGPIGSWDVSAMTDTSKLFLDESWNYLPGADKFNGRISKWEVSSVTTMRHMFQGATSFNGDLSKWDVSSVKDMYQMFCKVSKFNGDLSKWDVSSVANMQSMFYEATAFSGDISKWDVSNVNTMSSMFAFAKSFNGDVSKWDVSKVTNVNTMFQSAESFNGDISSWDVSSVTIMRWMFSGASSFAQTLCGAWLTSTANKKGMFDGSSGKMCTTTRTAATTTTTRTTTTTGWAPKSQAEMKAAIGECLQLSPDCSKGPHGPIGLWDVSAVTEIYIHAEDDKIPGMSKFNGDISKWDVSSVTNMHSMFWGATSFNSDISNWDVSSVVSMYGMFMDAAVFNDDISKWDVSSVKQTAQMFLNAAAFNSDLSKWDVSSVTSMFAMFEKAPSFNGDISKWDVSRVTNMRSMFNKASSFNGDLSKWDVSSVTHMYQMFFGASSFAQTLCGAWLASTADKDGMFDRSSGKICTTARTAATTTTSRTTTTTGWAPKSQAELKGVGFSPKSRAQLQASIKECLELSSDCSKGPHGPIGSWDVSAMADTSKLFVDDGWNSLPGADNFNGDVSKWEVSSVATMRHMFQGATSFNGDLSKWDVSSVKDMYQMFCKVSKLNGDLSKWDVSSVANMQNMFYDATAFNGDISKWDVSKVNTMSSMFAFAKSFNGDVSKWDVSEVTNVNTMFQSASLFNGDMSKWDVSRVTNMKYMFASALTFNGDISKWDVSSVIFTHYMFAGASKFNIDLSKWDVSRVNNMQGMFVGASSFAQTLCGAWLTSTADKDGMFERSSGKMCTTATTTTTMNTSMCSAECRYIAGLIATCSAVIILVVVSIFICIKAKTSKHEKGNDPYHLAEYGLATFVKEGDLRADNVLEKDFESSHFRVVKDALTQRVKQLQMVLPVRYITDAIRGLIKHHIGSSCQHEQVERLMVQTEIAMAQNNELAEDAGVKAEMFWSSALRVKGTELCSMLNAAIRQDDPANIVHAAVFAKGLEMRRNMDRLNMADLSQKYPNVQATADMFPGGEFPECLEHQDWRVCWRGGGFNNDFKDFFVVGKYYRCPGFLATSLKKDVSMKFLTMQMSKSIPTIQWIIVLDGKGTKVPKYRCMHASFVLKSHLSAEHEFLFSPYSVFQVIATEWSPKINKHHTIVLRAAIDNMNHPEDLPLAPWY